jgi:DNA-binding CsgD family transcriptional regulator
LEELQSFGDYMTTFPQEHLLFLAKYTEWIAALLEEERLKQNYAYQYTICGLSVTNKKGEKNRLLVRALSHSFTKEGYADTLIVSIEKINFMMKSPIVWARMAYGKNENKVAYISTLEFGGKISDIISDREKEVLQCLAEGMDTQEIAKTLFISANTIIKHRKNMLARTGLCDTTALIQICQSCGVLS